MNQTTTTPNEKLLTFRSGGWLLLAAAVPVVLIIGWAVAGMIARASDGDFEQHYSNASKAGVEAFGFDLSTALVPAGRIVAAAEYKGYIGALHTPGMIPAAEVARINAEQRGKYLVSNDRVIGIVIDGEARAYPLRMLDWHEVINDEVGPAGVPVAVTYNGLCDSAIVFDRRVSGETLQFGVSGLLYNSNHLLYDIRENSAQESLWSQLQFRAVAGPAAEAGRTLTILPCELVTWADWTSRHPESLVLAPNPDPARHRYYRRDTYGAYFSSDRLQFPVEPMPDDGRALKTRTISALLGDEWHTFAHSDLLSRADDLGRVEVEIDGERYVFHVNREPPTVRIKRAGSVRGGSQSSAPPGPEIPVVYSFWFAWHAMHPEAALRGVR